MNIVDGIIWLSIGFAPTFLGLELAWRLVTKKLAIRKAEGVHV